MRLGAVGLLSTALVLTACGGGGEGDADGETFTIGAVLPLSGPLAGGGDEMRRGYELAVEKAGGEIDGTKIELKFGDAPSAEAAVTESERLITREGADALMGTYMTALSQAGSEVAARNGLPWIETNALTDALTERGLENYFRTGPTASQFATSSIDFIADALAPKLGGGPLKVFLENEDGPYGQAIAAIQEDTLEELGYEVEVGSHAATAVDVTDAVLAAKRFDPDVWVITGYESDTSLLTKTAQQQSFDPSATVFVAAGDTQLVLEAVGQDALTDKFAVTYSSESSNGEWAPENGFYDEYRDKYGEDPVGAVASTAYAGMTSFLTILGDADGTDLDSITKAARAIDIEVGGIPGGWGLQFDEAGENERVRLVVVQWRDNGTNVAVWPLDAAADGESLAMGE
ncbi:ABC transporter substrate-binding protein [Nocardioides houyundeii]|uniref:ABC transporter substrate-binding protein n=1 Tax=Nocardioides houyundeii TaxID=2045452 RepID=UPI0023DCED55|nr:ABC transporter substrate-binding protein [Nocardioides houyundeii]